MFLFCFCICSMSISASFTSLTSSSGMSSGHRSLKYSSFMPATISFKISFLLSSCYTGVASPSDFMFLSSIRYLSSKALNLVSICARISFWCLVRPPVASSSSSSSNRLRRQKRLNYFSFFLVLRWRILISFFSVSFSLIFLWIRVF